MTSNAIQTLPVRGPAVPTEPAAHTARREQGRRSLRAVRDEVGATTAEYAVCTGAGVGLAGVLFKILTSPFFQQILKSIFTAMKTLIPF